MFLQSCALWNLDLILTAAMEVDGVPDVWMGKWAQKHLCVHSQQEVTVSAVVCVTPKSLQAETMPCQG